MVTQKAAPSEGPWSLQAGSWQMQGSNVYERKPSLALAVACKLSLQPSATGSTALASWFYMPLSRTELNLGRGYEVSS